MIYQAFLLCTFGWGNVAFVWLPVFPDTLPFQEFKCQKNSPLVVARSVRTSYSWHARLILCNRSRRTKYLPISIP